jgi:hypothetical protein
MFEMSADEMLAGKLAILIELFFGFLQSPGQRLGSTLKRGMRVSFQIPSLSSSFLI